MSKAMRRPAPPQHLSERSHALWTRLVPATETPGRLALFQAALEQLDRIDEARALIARDGLVSSNDHIARLHPAARAEKDAIASLTRLWRELGLHQEAEKW